MAPTQEQAMQAPEAIPGKCNARNRNGTLCRRTAGWGTEHVGAGRCSYHTGSTPNGVKSAAVESLTAEGIRLGLSIEMEPHDLMLTTVYAAAGSLQHAQARVAEVAPDQEDTPRGRYAQERHGAALDRAARVAKDAMTAGVSDRRIRLARRWGELIAQAAERAMGRMAERFPPDVRVEFAGYFQAEMLRLERGEIEEGQ